MIILCLRHTPHENPQILYLKKIVKNILRKKTMILNQALSFLARSLGYMFTMSYGSHVQNCVIRTWFDRVMQFSSSVLSWWRLYVRNLRGCGASMHFGWKFFHGFFSRIRRKPATWVSLRSYILTWNDLGSMATPVPRLAARTKARSPVAPASINWSASAFMIWRSTFTVAIVFWKHLALCSFQICQETSVNREGV